MQNSIVEYLYEVGVHPEIGICVEYLSWNKEQRIYMSWLSSMFFNFFEISKDIEAKKKITEDQQSNIKY